MRQDSVGLTLKIATHQTQLTSNCRICASPSPGQRVWVGGAVARATGKDCACLIALGGSEWAWFGTVGLKQHRIRVGHSERVPKESLLMEMWGVGQH